MRTRFLGKPWLLVELGAVGGCAALLGHAATQAMDFGEPRPPAARPPAHELRPSPSPRADLIVSRNIFCSSCRASAAPPADDTPLAWRPTALPIVLVGVMSAPAAGPWSAALVRDLDDRSFLALGIGGRVRGAIITEIRPTRIYLRAGETREYLDLTPEAPAPVAPRPEAPVARAIREIGPEAYEISRATLQDLLGNSNGLVRTARVVPEVRDGRPAGFRLLWVDGAGPLGQLGLQAGDSVVAVNGLSIASPESALEAYVKLRAASHIAVDLERSGWRLSKEVRVR